MVKLGTVGVLGFALTFILLEESKVTVDDVQKQISEGDEIVSPAVCEEVEAILAGEDEIALEESLLSLRDVLALFIHVLHG